MTPGRLELELPRLAAHDCDLQGILTWLELWLSGFSTQQNALQGLLPHPSAHSRSLDSVGLRMWGPGFAFQPSCQVMPLVCGPHFE